MTDIELLEHSARAAGIDGKIRRWQMPYSTDHNIGIGKNRWNPLESDADAFRLAIKLNLFEPEILSDWQYCIVRTQHSDICANYRRAIVGYAARVGKSMIKE